MSRRRKKQKGGGWTPALKKAIEVADDVRQTRSEVSAIASEAAAMPTELPALSMEEAAAKVTVANRLMKQPYSRTLPGAGCMPLAMGGMPESPWPLPPIPCPRSGIPSWLEALGVAGPDPIAMIPMPPFVGGVIAADDLRGDVEKKISKFEASNKLAAEAKAKGIPMPPDVEGADWETKASTHEAYRLLKPGQILLPWDTDDLDKKLADVGVKPSIPVPKPKPSATSMTGEEVSEAEIAKLNKGTGKKMVVFEKGFTWKGGGRKSRKKKHRRKKRRKTRRGGMPKKKKASRSTPTPWKCERTRPDGKLIHNKFFKTKEERDAHHKKHDDRQARRLGQQPFSELLNEHTARIQQRRLRLQQLEKKEAALKARLRKAEEAAAAADAAVAADAAAADAAARDLPRAPSDNPDAAEGEGYLNNMGITEEAFQDPANAAAMAAIAEERIAALLAEHDTGPQTLTELYLLIQSALRNEDGKRAELANLLGMNEITEEQMRAFVRAWGQMGREGATEGISGNNLPNLKSQRHGGGSRRRHKRRPRKNTRKKHRKTRRKRRRRRRRTRRKRKRI